MTTRTYQICSPLRQAEEEKALRPDPIKMLASLHASGGGLSKKAGEAYLEHIKKCYSRALRRHSGARILEY